ncbi:Uncharacterized protein HZ326_16738 [Fusarium oxysporum f. sp. albedinis]|nr:Uncharacterized protein HZ326_16738 [Fusarium oxysporum f. sp. albedinis]
MESSPLEAPSKSLLAISHPPSNVDPPKQHMRARTSILHHHHQLHLLPSGRGSVSHCVYILYLHLQRLVNC